MEVITSEYTGYTSFAFTDAELENLIRLLRTHGVTQNEEDMAAQMQAVLEGEDD